MKAEQKIDKRVSRALIGSMVVHVALWTLISFTPREQKPQVETIQLEVLPSEPAAAPSSQAEVTRTKKFIRPEEQQVVDQDDQQLNDEVEKDTRFLGKHNQRVIKQQVAKDNGEFKNVKEKTGAPGKNLPLAKNDSLRPKSLLLQPKFDLSKTIQERDAREREVEENSPLQKSLDLENSRQPAGAPENPGTKRPDRGHDNGGDRSQTLDYLRDIDPGLETALSTKEFVYHGYYSRIRRQLEQYWGPTVRQKITDMHRKGRNIASSEDKVTKCLVTLDEKGNILRIQVIGDSGLRELDEAAVDAFKSAAPFPNPPKGMKDTDGTIKIRWDFILEA